MKSGYVAIIGEPNVGKSTLINRFINTKLSIVSDKPQTTRNKILGILTEGDYQCVFIDTPGIFEPSYELQERMVAEARAAIRDADLLVWLVDPFFKPEKFPAKFIKLFDAKRLIIAINKIDLVKKNDLLPLIEKLKVYNPEEIFPISAINGDGVEDLKKAIMERLPESPFLYESDQISDQPERFFVGELIREKLFLHLKKEVPYATCVIIEEFKEQEGRKVYIRATIYVEKNTQKQILIGRDGRFLKKIGTEARKDIENFLGRDVYLDLWVKVKEKWRKDPIFLKELGY
ncbi:MAG: GTPase Era [candidate division WOR-3 bacterium]|nr:GTPase Era [candidate division WOR-3 bacterium]